MGARCPPATLLSCPWSTSTRSGRDVTRFMTVLLDADASARVVFRGTFEQCERVAADYLRETFILPTRY